jgi:hypothetical protein
MEQPIKLLTVEGTSLIDGYGVLVMPNIPVNSYSGSLNPSVILQMPDGQKRKASASLDIPRINPEPTTFHYLCVIVGLAKNDIPIGTEIWIDDCLA